ncbi:hypothetical protein C5167_043511 [Papaver somniferum]|uniref:Uncharacterized protein n=1 Tax=Papaver somniferum TaxID=3469 RepID=A0A4Y7L8L3_PAPSO|nr:hypothetical protein C5167_043511 [Papaver somniferum]
MGFYPWEPGGGRILFFSSVSSQRNMVAGLIKPKDVVYECRPGCINRTSQRGLRYRLEVFRILILSGVRRLVRGNNQQGYAKHLGYLPPPLFPCLCSY